MKRSLLPTHSVSSLTITRKVMASALPTLIRDALLELPPSVSNECRLRATQLLALIPLPRLKSISIFDDDGDITLHWFHDDIFCDVRKDPVNAGHTYRLNKIDKTSDGRCVSNVFFALTAKEAQTWLENKFTFFSVELELMQGETLPGQSTSDFSVLGTHTWIAYLLGLLPSLYILIWTLLVLAGVFNTITHAWDLILFSSIMVFSSLSLLVANAYMSKGLLLKCGNSLEQTIQYKTLKNDFEFAMYYLMAGLCFLCLATVGFIDFHEVDGNKIDISNVNNTKFVMTRITAAIGFLLSFFCVAKFLLTDQNSGFAILWSTLVGAAEVKKAVRDDEKKRK